MTYQFSWLIQKQKPNPSNVEKYVATSRACKSRAENKPKRKKIPYFDKIQTELYCFSICCWCCWCVWCKLFRFTTTTTTVGVRSLRRTFNFCIAVNMQHHNQTTKRLYVWLCEREQKWRKEFSNIIMFVLVIRQTIQQIWHSQFLYAHEEENLSFSVYWNFCILLPLPKWVVQGMHWHLRERNFRITLHIQRLIAYISPPPLAGNK